jgi:hypothetical protein
MGAEDMGFPAVWAKEAVGANIATKTIAIAETTDRLA